MTPVYKAVCKNFQIKFRSVKSVKSIVFAVFFSIALSSIVSEVNAQCVSIPSNSGGSVSQNDINCKGTASGSLILTTYVKVTVSYPFAWEWRSGSAVGPILSSGTATGNLVSVVNGGIYNLAPGTYVLVTCNSALQQYRTQSFTIIEPASGFVVDTTFTAPTCNGGNNGKAVVTATGGVPTYTYLWSTGDIGNTVDTLRAGINYSVDVTDQNQCVITQNFTLSNPTSVSGTVTSTPSCTGVTNGTATVTPAGGTGTYTYLWNDGLAQTTQKAIGLAAGNYTVVVKDGNNCPSAPIPVTVNTVANPTATITSIIQATCGANDGSAVADGSGGTGLYTYSWNNGDLDSIANNIGFGTYIVTVTDKNLCTDTASVNISVRNPPVVTIAASANPICNGSGTTLTASSTHGGSTSYVWSGGTISGAITTSVSVSPNTTTTYTVIGKDSPGCADTTTIIIDVNPIPVITIAPPAQTICQGATATMLAGGGTTYVWTRNTGGGSVTINPVSDTPPVTTVYKVVGTTNGCSDSTTSTVTVNPLPSITITPAAPSICIGSNVSLTASGASTYTWDNSSGQLSGAGATVTATPPAVVGTYTYTATGTDAVGCKNTQAVTVTVVATPTITISPAAPSVCPGSSVNLTASGGTTYIWTDTFNELNPDNLATTTATPLATRTYTVTGTTGICSATANVTVTVSGVLVATIAPAAPAFCAGGNVSLTASGGTSYTWDNSSGQLSSAIGATVTAAPPAIAGSYTYTVTATSPGCGNANKSVTVTVNPLPTITINPATPSICNGSNVSLTASGAGAGTYDWLPNDGTLSAQTGATVTATPSVTRTYTVTGTDASGCVNTRTVTVTVNPLPVADPGGNQTICKGDSIIIGGSPTGKGGTSPYTYSWTTLPPGGISGSSTIGNPMAKPTVTSVYTVVVTDAKLCKASDFVTVNVNTLPIVKAGNDTTLCTGVSATLGGNPTASGNGPFNYNWNPTIGINDPSKANPVITPLSAGVRTYTVTVTDNNSCSGFDDVVITVKTTPIVKVSSNTSICFGVSDTLIASGATTYTWNNPVNIISAAGDTVIATPASTTTYIVTGTTGSCSDTASVTVTTNPALILNPGTPATICRRDSIAIGGASKPAYTYSWSPTAGLSNSIISNPKASPVTTTIYIVTATNNGCSTIDSVKITVNSLPTVNAGNDITICNSTSTVIGGAPSASGGSGGGYIYSWKPTLPPTLDFVNAANPTATPPTTTSYILNVTDGNTCSGTDTIVVTVGTPLVLDTDSTLAQCGIADGSVTVAVSGGSPGYTYSWTPLPGTGNTTATFSNLFAGAYKVDVTDSKGCKASANTSVNNPGGAIVSKVSQTDVLCNGSCTGAATVSAVGNAPFTFTWNTIPAQNGATATALCAGTQIVSVLDAKQCITNFNVVITSPAVIKISMATVDPKCNGGNNGSATATVTGGTAPYTYAWNTIPAQGTATASNLSKGKYILNVTDALGCTKSDTIQIDQPLALTSTITASTINCFGLCTGSASVSVIGGTGTYTYSWGTSPVQTTAATTATLCAGTYLLNIKDVNNCSIDTIATITQPAQIAFTLTVTDASCLTSNGGAAITINSGGVAPLTYKWSKGGEVTTSISNQPSGSYPFRVTDANGCFHDTIANINDVGGPTISSITATNVSCSGKCDGTATVVVAAGVAPLSYVWNNAPDITATAASLCANTYIATVTDKNGCKTSSTPVTVGAPVLNSAITTTPPKCVGSCDGTATVTVVGGSFPYTYLWPTTLTSQTGQTATGLCIGNYPVDVTDKTGCIFSGIASATITAPAALSLTMTQINIVCGGANTGAANVTATGGTGVYTYSWFPNVGSGSTVSNLSAGKYKVTVTDGNSCSAVDSVTIIAPGGLVATASQASPITCNGFCNGSTTVAVAGGTGPFTYSWNSTPVQLSKIADSLCAGTYIVTVTDANLCSDTASITLSAPAVLALTTSSTDAQCGIADGSATTIVSGGTKPYKYKWTPLPGTGDTTAKYSNIKAGAYNVLITDNNKCTNSTSVGVNNPGGPTVNVVSVVNAKCNSSCDGSAAISAVGAISYAWSIPPGATTPAVANLCSGTYTVAATDAKQCIGTKSIIITEPAPIVILLTSTDVKCNGGSDGTATSTVTGGSGPYTYSWNSNPVQKIADAIGLSAGTYKLTVTDINGCSMSSSPVVIAEPGAITISTIANSNSLCNGDCNNSITASVLGGTAPFTHSWNTTPIPQTTLTATGLCAGSYIITSTDAKGCQQTATQIITQPSAISLSMVITSATCNVANGKAKVKVDSGGVAPFTYDWHPGATDSITNVPAGIYTVTVRDVNGCVKDGIATISDSNGPAFNITTTSPKCPGGNDGTITATVTTVGTGPYKFSWSSSPGIDTNATAAGLKAGSYSVIVKDAMGCTSAKSDSIVDPTPMSVFTTTNNVLCSGDSSGSATAIAINGTSPYTYKWDKPFTGLTVNGLKAGAHTVIVTDLNGCKTTNTIIITAPTALTVTANQTNITCFGGKDGTATATAANGIGPYKYSWAPYGGTGATAFDLVANTPFTITVTDANGCMKSATVTLTQPVPIGLTLTEVASITCATKCDGSASVKATGGSGIYTYLWSTIPAQTTQTAVGLCSGIYTLTSKDAAGCTRQGSIIIAEPQPLTLTTSSTNAQCLQSDGTVTVVASGGKPSYTYSWNTPAKDKTATADSIPAGPYLVTVTDANGCKDSTGAGVSNLNGPVVTIVSSTNPTCNGVCDGKATVSASGRSPFTYLWNNGNTNAAATALCGFKQVVAVADNAGCKTTLDIPLADPSPLRIDLSFSNITCNGVNNGTATANVSGGTSPYTYKWSDGQKSAIATGLKAGTYTLDVTDVNNCFQKSATVTIVEPAAMKVTLTVNGIIQCYGQCNNSITAHVSGGLIPYAYVWNTNPIQFTATATGLCAGKDTVIIKDANGCSVKKGNSIAQPAEIVLSLTHTDIIACNQAKGSACVIVVSGGVPSFTYSWNTQTQPIDTSKCIINKPAGIYRFTIQDANGCKKDSLVGISNVGGPIASVTATDATCIGSCNGTATVAVASLSGTAPYTFKWDDLPSGQITATATGLCAGTYTPTVTDKNGCIGIGNSVNINAPSLTVSANPTTGCQGTVVNLTGTAPSTGTILWTSTGNGTFTFTNTINSQYTTNAAGIDIITVTWTSTDPGCTPFTKSFTLNVVASPKANAVSPVGMNCQGVPIALTGSTFANGTISWSTFNGSSQTGSFSNISIAAPTYFPLASESGTTILTMTVDNGICRTTGTVSITWKPNAAPVAGSNQTICKAQSVQLNPSFAGATGVIWSTTGDGTFAPNVTTPAAQYIPGASDTASGSVILTLKTTGGCGSNSSTMTVNIKATPTISAGADQLIILGKSAILKGSLTGASNVIWTTSGCGSFSPNNTTLNTSYIPCEEDQKDTILLIITSSDGCKVVTDNLILIIRVVDVVDVFTPYPTTPGFNDLFVLPNLPDNSHLVIFDRWGLKVFEAQNYKNDWDGEGLPSATYFYILENPRAKPRTGYITLLRE